MPLKVEKIKTDLCVIGGGMAGISVAITAARLGVKVALVHERPVFGGNASSEIRMWVCGADMQYRETGLMEEIRLENQYYNPTKNYNLWDSVLYNKVKTEENITALLNCTCFDASAQNGVIKSVTAYQMTTQKIYQIEATNYADCSGDSILAPLTGAKFEWGREGQAEYGEPMKTHYERDEKTMGNSCLIQARKVDRVVPFRAPDWAEKVSVEKLKGKFTSLDAPGENFWYLELGGVTNIIDQAENINARLIALALGVWDTIKNSGEFDADYYDLEFLGFLGAKRESRRMMGDYVLTANDIMDGRIFPDTVAYGGWPLDDHNPEGFDGDKSNYTIKVRKPYGIPYRCLYSQNIENLFFAGRNISATHMAMSSARVMGTCSVIGQAVGVASHICKKYNLTPRQAGAKVEQMQDILLKNDCYLPSIARKVAQICSFAQFNGNEVLRNGCDRESENCTNKASVNHGSPLTYTLDKPQFVTDIKIVFDADLFRKSYAINEFEQRLPMRANIYEGAPDVDIPQMLAKEFIVEIENENGETKTLYKTAKNLKRSVILPVNSQVKSIKFTVLSNWGGSETSPVFTYEFD